MNILGYSSERNQIKSLIILGISQGIVSEEDSIFLQKATSIQLDTIPLPTQAGRLKRLLPTKRFKKFKLIYTLVGKILRRGQWGDRAERILQQLLSVLNMPFERSRELLCYLQNNIVKGLSVDQSYHRLGYLVL